ncbi:hypothetical protein BGZ72_009955 [Mortierella alpina]|nr:hypothetical protein BGZ72_009955 [Mortierella alpina]
MKILRPIRGSKDDTKRIQDAIDEVGNLPLNPYGLYGPEFRGAVLLKKGVYRVAGPLFIDQSGVVLRGEGSDRSGTTILATGEIQGDFILMNGASSTGKYARMGLGYSPPRNEYRRRGRPSVRTRKGANISVGATILPVEDTRGFYRGDKIVIERPQSVEWIKDIQMDRESWNASAFIFRFERTIVSINRGERTFTIDIPMVMSIEPKYFPDGARISHFYYKYPMISDVGIEHLRISKVYSGLQPQTMHAVQISNTIHGWVRDVSTDGFMVGIEANRWTRFITIQNCNVDCRAGDDATPKRRYGFVLNGQMGLVNNCTAIGAFYDFTSNGPTCGPNVFVDSYGRNTMASTGPLQRWVMGTLYDNIISSSFRLENRPTISSGSDSIYVPGGWTERKAGVAILKPLEAPRIGSLDFNIPDQRSVRAQLPLNPEAFTGHSLLNAQKKMSMS